MRFAAPEDVSEIRLASGPLTVVDGFVEVPDDIGPGDLGGLAVNGFAPAPEGEPKPAATSKSAPGRSAASDSEPESAS